MTTTTVSNTAALLSALKLATSGDTILVAAGTYSNVNISNLNFSTNVLIRSVSLTSQAIFSDLNVNNVTGLTLRNLDFYSPDAGVGQKFPKAIYPFNVTNSNSIVLDKITAMGSAYRTLADQASCLQIEGSTHVTVSNSSFEYFHHVISQINNNGVSIRDNTFNYIFDDGIRGGGTSNITITGNHFANLGYQPGDPDHTDCIQFWTDKTTTSAKNIVITNNTYVRGVGDDMTHGIFLQDLSGVLPFTNVTISGNNFTGAGWEGISVNGANKILVTNNTLVPYSDTPSHIWVMNSANVTVTNNTAASFKFLNDTNLTQSGNVVVPSVPVGPDEPPALVAGTNSPLTSASSTPFVQAMATMSSAALVISTGAASHANALTGLLAAGR